MKIKKNKKEKSNKVFEIIIVIAYIAVLLISMTLPISYYIETRKIDPIAIPFIMLSISMIVTVIASIFLKNKKQETVGIYGFLGIGISIIILSAIWTVKAFEVYPLAIPFTIPFWVCGIYIVYTSKKELKLK